MRIIIKYHEKTPQKNQIFVLDLSKNHQICEIEDENLTEDVYKDLSKYDGCSFFGVFIGYSRIDGFSIFKIDTNQIDRECKISKILEN
jgi:hypothetical protein